MIEELAFCFHVMKIMEDLKRDYHTAWSRYQELVKNPNVTPESIEKVKAANVELSRVVSNILQKLTFVRQDTSDISSLRDSLRARLAMIQYEYNQLTEDSDKRETLRRIREHAEEKEDKQLPWYMLFFGIACAILIVVILVKSFWSQSSDLGMSAVTASTPMSIPTLSQNDVL